MLKYIRDMRDKPAAKILIGIMAVSLAGWGASGWILGQTKVDDYVVKIGKESITLTHIERERSRQMHHLDREQQKQILTDRAAGINFNQQILSMLASQLMLEQRARDLGMAVSNTAVANAIRAEPVFQENGKFSPE